MTEPCPRRRRYDGAWYAHMIRENWYRDVWMLVISGIVLAVAISAYNHRDDRINALQDSRVEATARNCRDSNVRHDRTIAALDRVLLRAATGRSVRADTPRDEVARRLTVALADLPRARRVRMTQSRTSTVLLIEALAPRKNCRQAVNGITPDD